MVEVYISGKMTGLPDYGKEYFEYAEKYIKQVLKENTNEYLVIHNPYKMALDLSKKKGQSLEEIPREEFMKRDLRALLNCHMIFMLPNYIDSQGAQLELQIARELKIPIFYLELLECDSL